MASYQVQVGVGRDGVSRATKGLVVVVAGLVFLDTSWGYFRAPLRPWASSMSNILPFYQFHLPWHSTIPCGHPLCRPVTQSLLQTQTGHHVGLILYRLSVKQLVIIISRPFPQGGPRFVWILCLDKQSPCAVPVPGATIPGVLQYFQPIWQPLHTRSEPYSDRRSAPVVDLSPCTLFSSRPLLTHIGRLYGSVPP